MTQPKHHITRIIPRNGMRMRVKRIGTKSFTWRDLYIYTLDCSWITLIVSISGLFIGINSLFALLYLFGGDTIENAHPHSFADAFFFSVQTMATIGFGKLVPKGLLANILVTVEALIGLSTVAVFTGIIFAKLSKPTARVLFSRVAVIAPHDGIPSFMFRLANERLSRIIDPTIRVTLARDEVTKEGQNMRRFHELTLIRSYSPVLLLTWTVIHPITEDSPLFGATSETLKEKRVEIVISLTGVDETLSHTIYAQHSYIAEEILCNTYFKDVISRDKKGNVEVDYNLFHQVLSSQT